jgi:hypothetical protein
MVLSPTAFTSASQPTIKLYKDGKGGNNTEIKQKQRREKKKEKEREKRKKEELPSTA